MKLLTLIKKFFKKIFCKPEKQTFKFGWVKDNVDPRDRKFKITAPHELPSIVDLRQYCPPVYNQGELGSCTANALGAAFQFEQIKQKKQDFIPSRLFIYYNERALEGTINEDAGAMIRDGIKTMVKDGVCSESMWKYDIWKFKTKPNNDCYRVALDNQVLEYLRISPHTLYEVKHCLSDGYPVAFGFTIYESFMSDEVARTGIASMPKPGEQSMGGHAVLAVGYDDNKQALIVRNSWGEKWGINGYFYLPYGYVEQSGLSADYWTIRLVE
jgi:C1A family cysteine protease